MWSPHPATLLTVAVPEAARLPTRTLVPPPLLAVFRQLNTAIAVSQMSSGQCRLAPLIQVIQDCSHLYHYTVKLLFKLHACESPPPPPRFSRSHRAAFGRRMTFTAAEKKIEHVRSTE